MDGRDDYGRGGGRWHAAEARLREAPVYDFTGLRRPDFHDLSLILTARLAEPAECVWVRALDERTAQVLRALRLNHLFRLLPTSDTVN